MRLIDADTLLHSIDEYFHDPKIDILINNAPTVETVKHGHWIEIENHLGVILPVRECSVCHNTEGATSSIKGHYCWYCGAKMDVVE